MALTEEEKKKKAQAEYAKKQEMLKSAKKSGTTTQPKKKPQDAGNIYSEKKVETKNSVQPKKDNIQPKKDYDYTPAAQKRTQQISESIADKTTPAKFSAKAVSSEAEKDYNKLPISPIQRGKQTVGENIARLAGVEQEALDDIRAKAIPKFGKDVFSESVDSGVANYISNLTGSLGKIYELSPNGFIANSLNKAIYGETRNPFEAINEPLQKWQEKEALEAQKAVENTGKGKSAENASRLITMATEMAPSVALSFIPGGQASSIANAAGTLGKVKGGFKALTSAKTFFPTLQQMTLSTIKDPVFWNSFGQILYPEYEEAVAKGASEGEATATALLSAFGQSALEKNFGIEKLPKAGAQTVKQAVFDFVKSAVGEGNEEVIQSIISGITQKLIFDHDQKLVSTSPEEDAVLNMANAFDEWIMAVAAGGIMGIPGALVNAGNIKAEANTNASVEPVVEPPVSPAEAPIAEAENVTPETANEQEGAFANGREKAEVENQNKEEAGTLASVEDIESKIAKVEQEMQNLEKTTFAENPEQSPADFYDGQEWRNLKKKKKDLEEQRDFLDAISYRNKNLPFEKDENGRYIMYHGSPLDFDEFDTDRMGGLINFAPEYEPASWYSAAGLRGVFKNDVDRYVIGEDRETLYRRTAEDRDVWEPFARGKQSEDGFSYEILPFKDDGEKVALKTITSNDIDNPDLDYYATSVSANVGKYAVKADNTLDLDDETRYKQNLALWKKIRDDAYKAVKDNKISTNVFTQVQSIYLGARDEKTFRGFWSTTKREYASRAFKDFIVPELKKYGFDSIYHKDDGHKTLVVFEPEQASQIAKRYFWGNGEFVPTKANNATNAQVNSTNDVVEPANDVVEQANAQSRAQGDGGFGTNTVGAAQSNPTTYAHLQNEHGVFEPGESPSVRDPNVPLKDAQGNRVSQSVRTIMEAAVTTDELIPAFEKEVAAGTFKNKGTSNKEAVEKATKRISDHKSYGEAVNEFRRLYSDDKLLSKDDLVFGEILFSMAAQNGEADVAMEIASMLASNNSRTGDAHQAQRILKRLSPEGRLYHAQQITNKFNKDKHQKTEIKLSEETVKKVLEAKTDEEIEVANDAVAEDIAKQIDKGFLNDIAGMWNAWRYLSMLGNPKTHIRNIFGNLAFLPVRKVKNIVKAGIESGAKKAGWIDEKTATVKLASKENREFAKESFEKNKKTLLEGGNYRFESEIDSKIEPFRFSGKETPVKKFFNAVFTPARKGAEFNSKALEAEDAWFLRNAYIDSLTQYLTANKIDAQNITPAQKANAESYAAQEAQKATYRDYSAIASALENLSNREISFKGRKIKLRPLVDAVVPFRKTPINVLARGIEYSPVGLATTILFDGKAVKDGNISANDMIDHLASGLTGSGLFALGMFLAKEGLISGGESDDKNEKEFAKLQGEQAYALKIGDGSYTIDWLAPAALPVFVGVETMKVLEKEYGNTEKWTDTAWTILKNLDKIANPMLELSMLQNLDSFLGSNYSKDGNALSGLAQDLVASYVLQAVPTLLSQVAQTMDGTRRNAYYVDKTDKIPDEWQIPLQRAMAKIPGLSKELPAYVDAWGRTQKQSDNVGVRIVENFLSPGYYKKKTVTEVDEMLKQLIKQTGDTSLAPKGPSQKYVTVDNVDHPLSAKEYEQMSIEKGKKQYDIINQLVANKTYTQLDAETKAKAIKGVYEYSGALSKEGVHGYKLPKEWVKAEKAKEDGLAEGTYISLKSSMSGKEKDIDKMEYLIADKGTTPKEKVVAMEYLTDINMKKYEKFSKDPKDIINARMIYLEEHAKGGEGTDERIIKKIFADKGTTAKEDIAFMENVLNKDMSKYKDATKNNPEAMVGLYNIISDDAKKDEDLKAIEKKFKVDEYKAREMYYKAKGDWNKTLNDVIDNGTNRDKKISVYRRFKFSNADIVTGYNAVIGLSKKDEKIKALTKAFGNKNKATIFYNISQGNKGYK